MRRSLEDSSSSVHLILLTYYSNYTLNEIRDNIILGGFIDKSEQISTHFQSNISTKNKPSNVPENRTLQPSHCQYVAIALPIPPMSVSPFSQQELGKLKHSTCMQTII